MYKLKNKKVAVFGLGKSGMATVEKLLRLGAKVFVTDSSSQAKIDRKIARYLEQKKVQAEFNRHTEKALENTDLIVVSPGVHLDIPILLKAKSKHILIISELELAAAFTRKPIIAVTGTNGKTTTTTLIAKMLNDGGYRAIAAGNIGAPLIGIEDNKYDYLVTEVSSYQLETIKNFHPHISVILNITEDHIERHKSMQEYARVKGNVFINQTAKDYLIYKNEDRRLRKLCQKAKANKLPFSAKKALPVGCFCRPNGEIIFKEKGKELSICHKNDIYIKGEHNLENALAAISAALICKVPPHKIKQTLHNFKGVEHRIEFVRSIHGIAFYNDSKGTNPDSTCVAMKALGAKPGNILLIAGGRDKHTSLKELIELSKKYCRKIALIGEAKERFADEMKKRGFKQYFFAGSLKDAIMQLKAKARKNDIVLLSPACASFDMFSNYEERGRAFKQIVHGIKA